MADSAGIVLLGAGGHASVVAEAIRLSGQRLAGYLGPERADDDLVGDYLGNDPEIPNLAAQGFRFLPGLGFVNASGALRRANLLAALTEAQMATVIHPAAIVAPSATPGAGSFLAAGSVLGTRSETGVGAILNTGAVIDHDCRLGANCHVATGARIAGDVRIGRDVLIGAGATLRQGVSIGDGAVIGAGAVVITDVAAGSMMLGVPASPRSRA